MDRQLLDQEKNGLDRAWEFTKEINENIRHYNEHQTKYRTLASQWLIAAMAGVGFLFSANTGFPFDNLILIMLISLISALGILQLSRIFSVLRRLSAAKMSAHFAKDSKWRKMIFSNFWWVLSDCFASSGFELASSVHAKHDAVLLVHCFLESPRDRKPDVLVLSVNKRGNSVQDAVRWVPGQVIARGVGYGFGYGFGHGSVAVLDRIVKVWRC